MNVQLASFSGVVLAPSHVGFNFQIIFYKVIVLKFIFNLFLQFNFSVLKTTKLP